MDLAFLDQQHPTISPDTTSKLGFHPTRVVRLLLAAFHWMDPFADDDSISILGNLLGLKFE